MVASAAKIIGNIYKISLRGILCSRSIAFAFKYMHPSTSILSSGSGKTSEGFVAVLLQTMMYVQPFVWCGRLTRGEKVHFCSVCPFVSALKGDAVRHSCKHSKEKPFHCPDCEKSFTRKAALLYHQRTTHQSAMF